jgi:hypothetical protein
MMDLHNLTTSELLALHGGIADELRAREITRSSNSPTGDLAEYLFCKTFGWKQADNSVAHIDAIGPDGSRYQIKVRRITRFNKSRQLSALRDLQGAHFNFLAGILFTEDFSILRAAVIPHSVVLERSAFVERTNSHRFFLHDDVWEAPGVRDVTAEIRATVI